MRTQEQADKYVTEHCLKFLTIMRDAMDVIERDIRKGGLNEGKIMAFLQTITSALANGYHDLALAVDAFQDRRDWVAMEEETNEPK